MNPHRYGDVGMDEEFPGPDYIEDFIAFKRSQDVNDDTVEVLVKRLHENGAGTALGQYLERQGVAIEEASLSDLRSYRDDMREGVLSEGEIENRLIEASTMYTILMIAGVADGNPAGVVVRESDFDTDIDRVKVTVSEMADFLRDMPDPQMRALATCYLKWGARKSELINLDLCCVHLDDPRYHAYLDERGIELHEDIVDRPDSVLIYGDYQSGDEVNGEIRRGGTRRDYDTVVPVDHETRYVLLEWLTMRPRAGPPHPVFTSVWPRGGGFSRISPTTVYNTLIQDYAMDAGLAEPGGDSTDVDIHFFRHFYRTQMKHHWGDHDGWIDKSLIKYIRGDKIDDDILEYYRQDTWGVNTREPYLANIYTFGLDDR